mgnify:CR=1 FL=1
MWRAKQQEPVRRDVALKILDDALVGQPGMLELLRHECRQARRLVHPNIVRVFDFHADEDRAFISMEYIQGGELGQLRDAAPAEHVENLDRRAEARGRDGKNARATAVVNHLPPGQRRAVAERDVLGMIAEGGNVYYLAKLAGIWGLNVQDLGAAQTGMSVDAFKAKLLEYTE